MPGDDDHDDHDGLLHLQPYARACERLSGICVTLVTLVITAPTRHTQKSRYFYVSIFGPLVPCSAETLVENIFASIPDKYGQTKTAD